MPPALPEFLSQTLLIATLVAALLLLTRRGSAAVAGLSTAALSAPTLALLAHHEGLHFAQRAALGTLLTTPICAQLSALALSWLARQQRHPPADGPSAVWLSPLLAGLMSAAICAMANGLGALSAGFISGLPLVASWTMLGTLRHSGGDTAARYVRAYQRGLWPRCLMNLVFALAAMRLDAVSSMAIALGISALLLIQSSPSPHPRTSSRSSS